MYHGEKSVLASRIETSPVARIPEITEVVNSLCCMPESLDNVLSRIIRLRDRICSEGQKAGGCPPNSAAASTPALNNRLTQLRDDQNELMGQINAVLDSIESFI